MTRGKPVITVLILIAALTAAFSLPNASAPPTTQVDEVSVTTDFSDYIIGSEVEANATIEYSKGPLKDLDEVRFDWYTPLGALLFSENVALEASGIGGIAYAYSYWDSNSTGINFKVNATINVTKGNATQVSDFAYFNVSTTTSSVVVTDISIATTKTSYAKGALVEVTATLTFSGNASLLSNVNFVWFDESGGVITTTSAVPEPISANTARAQSSWLSNRFGQNMSVSAMYTGVNSLTEAATFSVVAAGDGSVDGLDSDFIYLLLILAIVCIVLLTITMALFMLLRRKKEEPEEEPKPSAPVIASTAPVAKLEAGNTYLVDEKIPEGSFKLLAESVRKGDKGLVFTRTYPQKVRERHKLALPIIWLSRDQSETSISPTNLGKIAKNIEVFLNQHKGSNTIILLDGLEYLIVENNFPLVLKFINQMNDTVSINNSKLLISFDLETLTESERALISKDVKAIRG